MIYPKKILIAEDDPASAEYLKLILQESGYEVVFIAETGLEAIEQCKALKPNLVLMDIILKGNISGCEAALQLKHLCNDIKVIYLTAHATPEMIEYAVESEAYGYLMKPYRRDEILATLKLVFAQGNFEKPTSSENIIPLKDGYVYDMRSSRLMKENHEVLLCKKQLKLIEILAKNKNTIVSHEQICSFVWGQNKSECTLRTLIHRIRSAVESDMIKNVHGRGYEIVI